MGPVLRMADSSRTERPAREPTIVCSQLTKVYETQDGGDVLALDQIDISVGEREFLAVVGPSGCGKSTLLRLVGGLMPFTSGELKVGGKEVLGPRRDIGVVFQSATLLEWRTVLENVLLPVDVLGLDRRTYRDRALRLLATVGLAGFESKYPNELSGGMQQRVALSRALVHDPALLLMDEPFGALDALTRETMNLELQRIWMETAKTVLLITHSIPEAVFLADRVAVMTARPGRLQEIIEVDIPRPRSLEVMATPEFGRIVSRIRSMLNSGGALD